MATILDPKQTVDLREVVISEIIQSEALVNFLEESGVLHSCKNRRLKQIDFDWGY